MLEGWSSPAKSKRNGLGLGVQDLESRFWGFGLGFSRVFGLGLRVYGDPGARSCTAGSV